MKIPKRGEKGFTLIELLIVVAILGVLAAVVIPNVGKFIGKGKTEAAATEMANIQSAVISMMTDTSLAALPTGNFSTTSTNNMAKFPDPNGGADSTPPGGSTLFAWNDNSTVNYVVTQNTTKYYTVNAQGTVKQWDSAGLGP